MQFGLATVLAAIPVPVVGQPIVLKLSCLGTDSGAAAGIVLSVNGHVVASGLGEDRGVLPGVAD